MRRSSTRTWRRRRCASSTDTRTIEPGDTFVALRGERFDGHDFAAEAVRRGAAMLVRRSFGCARPGVAAMLVDDTKAAYMALAGAARALFRGRVIAITGSTGKTTTKSFLTQLLAVKYGDRVLAAPENENNEIGVSKLLLNASNEAHDVLVVEMGARHYGDIAALVEIARPQLGILTNIGEAHLEIMGSRERLEATKWATLLGRRARRSSTPPTRSLAQRAPSARRAGALVRASRPALDAYPELERVNRDRGATVSFIAAGVASASILSTCAYRDCIIAQISRPQSPARSSSTCRSSGSSTKFRSFVCRRGATIASPWKAASRFIYDAYNANASGMIAALDAFASEAASRRIAVLASMAELGDESQALHERVGAHAASKVDVLLVRGEYATDLARGATRGGLASRQIVFVETNARAARWLREHARPDDVVLLKGSRKYKLEEIVEELRT